MKFGEYLRALRKSKGMTLMDVGKLAHVSQPYLSQIEKEQKGIPSPEIIRGLSNALGVTHIGMMIKAGHLTEEEVLTYRMQNGVPN